MYLKWKKEHMEEIIFTEVEFYFHCLFSHGK